MQDRNKVEGIKFIVTGGAGFVGSSMVNLLMSKGADVTVYDNLSSGRYEFIKHHEGKKNFKFVKGELMDRKQVSDTFMDVKPDAVIHLAANPDVRYGTKKTDLDLEQGTIVTYNVLDAGRKSDTKNVMFASSSVVYGIADKKPTPEDYGPLKPISLYGSSKLASEGLVTAYGHLFGMNYYIYRFANVVGVNGTHGIILDFINKLKADRNELEVLGNGEQRKSYIDVLDLVDAMLAIYERSADRENIFNLATDDQISVKEITQMVVEATVGSTKIKYTGTVQGWPGDVPDAYLSNKKMKDFGITLKYGRSKDVVAKAIATLVKENWK